MNPIPGAVNSTPLCSLHSARGYLATHRPHGDIRQQLGQSKVDPSLKELLLAATPPVRRPALPPIQEDAHLPQIDAWERTFVFAHSASHEEEDLTATTNIWSRRYSQTRHPRRVHLVAIIEEALRASTNDSQ